MKIDFQSILLLLKRLVFSGIALVVTWLSIQRTHAQDLQMKYLGGAGWEMTDGNLKV